MAPKAKKEAPAGVVEPTAKKAKTDEEEKKEEAKYEEPDAAKDTRPALKENVEFQTDDTTLNVVPTLGGKLLTSLSDGGMAFLIAGARANVGQKAGRYMFEIKITHSVTSGNTGAQKPKQLIRVGFSTSSSSLFFGEDADSLCFDGEGFFMSERTKRVHGSGQQRFGKEQIVAVVLNLDGKSPNNNTVALYRDGVLISDPKPVPESLHGKPLFPHVCFRNLGVYVNFGPTALKELPFKCRMIQAAATSDVSVAPSTVPKDGKYDLVVPVAFPDEGTFDWLDTFLAKHPKHVELSDRKVIEWAKNSGLWSKGGNKSSNDKPAFSYGVPSMDDFSVRRVLNAVAPLVPRNYVVMEVKSNLLASERQDLLKKFNYPCYNKVAHVVMGEPNKEFKELVQNKILKEKQSKSDQAWRLKKAEKDRKKQLDTMAKAKAAELKKAVDEKKAKDAKAKEAREKAEKEKADKEAAEKKDEEKKDDEPKEGETKADEPVEDKKEEEPAKEEPVEDKKEEDKKEEEDEPMEEKKEEEVEETEPPSVELTDEEKAINFLQKHLPDLTPHVLSGNYAQFSTPESDEGFDKIRYEWDEGAKAKSYLKSWVLNRKLSTRLEDLNVGQEFKDKLAEFEKKFKEWKAAKTSGKTKKSDDDEPDIDISTVTDICDIGAGVSLFDNFAPEDWVLTQLRFELCLLCHSFKKDADDEDRVGIPVDHLGFYFTKYFGGKTFDHKRLGVTELKEVFTMLKDVLEVKDGLILATESLDSCDTFVKLTEEQRRKRSQRIEAGDETARLKFHPMGYAEEPRKPEVIAPRPDRRDYGRDKGDSKGFGKDKGGDRGDYGKGGDKGFGKDKGGDKGFGKDKDKGMDKGWGKPAEAKGDAWGKSQGKGDDKGWGKPAEKGDDKGWGKPAEKGGDKGYGKADDKGYGKADDKGWGKPADKGPYGKGDDKGFGKGGDKGGDKGWGKPQDKGYGDGGKGGDKGYGDGGKGGDKGWGKEAPKGGDKGGDKGWGGKSEDRGWGKGDDKGSSKGDDKGWGPQKGKGDDKGWGSSSKGDDKGQSRGWGQDEGKGSGKDSGDQGSSWGGNDRKSSWGGNDDKGWNQGGNSGSSGGWQDKNQGGGGGGWQDKSQGGGGGGWQDKSQGDDNQGGGGGWQDRSSPMVVPPKGSGRSPYDNAP